MGKSPTPRHAAPDQAHGLRQMFKTQAMHFVPLASNAEVIAGGVVMERLCASFTALGLKTLVVDAGDRARVPNELSAFDLSECIETLSEHVRYMPARGLPLRCVDARGDSGSLIDRLAGAAHGHDVILVHASASELVRIFGQRSRGYSVRPLVFTDGKPAGITQAYAAVKLMAQRASWLSYDLFVCTTQGAMGADRTAKRLAQCADAFLGAAQHAHHCIDPFAPATLDPGAHLLGMATEMLQCAWQHRHLEADIDARMFGRSALPSYQTHAYN